MPTSRNVAVLVGSLRRESFNGRIARIVMEMAPPHLTMKRVEIRELPLFDQDHEQDPPEPVRTFKQQIAAADAVLFVTPEYNRSVPGVLKNAIDHGSRPPNDSAWKGRCAAVISASPGPTGGFGANHHLRQSMVSLGVATMPTPEVYLGNVDGLLDADGNLTNPRTKSLLDRFLVAFEAWIELHAK